MVVPGISPRKPRPLTAEEQARVQSRLAAYRQEFSTRVTALARKLANGKQTLREWRSDMIVELRFLLLTSAAAGVGRVSRLRKDDLARVDQALRVQVGYLDAWIAQMEAAPALPSEAYIANRAKQYGGSGTPLAEQMTDTRAFQEFPELPFYPAQKTLCRNNCKCHWEWRILDRERGDADAYWRLGTAEHCETCLKRAQACSPLRCRSFQWQNLPSDPSLFV